ncbi:MAG: hypothetical protein LBC19_09470 [Tannerella sp.]|jgi:hypothetical protein|nr:hypothetical protein [Tannerella sp.]
MSKKIKTEEGSGSSGVLIANHCYDYVFKYLMDDSLVARKFISAIIGEEVVSLTTFAPQKYVRELENVSGRSWSFYRLDFSARIRIGETYKLVMIYRCRKCRLTPTSCASGVIRAVSTRSARTATSIRRVSNIRCRYTASFSSARA